MKLPYLIAEVGINHNGDIEIAKKAKMTDNLSMRTSQALLYN